MRARKPGMPDPLSVVGGLKEPLAKQTDCLSLLEVNWLLLMSMIGRLNQARGQGAADRCKRSCPSFAECHSSLSSLSRVAGQMCHGGGQGAAFSLASILASSPFPARFPQVACIVSWRPWGTDFEARKPSVCVGFVERVSEPRTYLANEVIITPGSLIG